jgi:tetratricopeptide (TPR) repeat protein
MTMPKLEYDPDLIERLARMHEGNASAHRKLETERPFESSDTLSPRWTQQQMLAASSLVIAASYWSLLSAEKAVSLYREAATLYREMGHSYWLVLALICMNGDDFAEALSAVDKLPARDPQMIAFAMVGNEMYGDDRRGRRMERLVANWRHVGNYPVGRLRIPLDYYGRCAEAMRDAGRQENAGAFFEGAANYIHRAAEVLQSASHDQFHWLRLESSILPAEPEAIAMATALSTVSRTMFDTPLGETSRFDQHGQLLVAVGEEIYRAKNRDGIGGGDPDRGQKE